MDSGAIMMIAFCTMMTIIVVAMQFSDYKSKSKKKDLPPEPPPAFTSLSLMAGLSFFSGLGAILLATIAGILSLTLSMNDVIPTTDSTRRQIDLAARIVLYASLLPAVGAAAFGLAARGVISESRGAVRGRPLYRTGILLALLTGVLVFDAKILNPSTWTTPVVTEQRTAARVEQGYLGVEPGNIDIQGGIVLVRVVPGSPADKAGLKAGDRIETVDRARPQELPPLGSPGQAWYSQGTNYLGAYIGSLKPGAQLTLGVRRGKETVTITVELAMSFDSLLELVKSQSLDAERMAILKAAGVDRRYSAGELRRLCAAFDLDDSRLRVIEPALVKLQDPQNAYQILGALDLPDSKTMASRWIEDLRNR
jgi:hypothetical protein